MNKFEHKKNKLLKVIWEANSLMRGLIDQSIARDYILALLFLKYITDTWIDAKESYLIEYSGEKDLIDELMKNERLVLPNESNFYSIINLLDVEPPLGERIDEALRRIEEENIKVIRCFF